MYTEKKILISKKYKIFFFNLGNNFIEDNSFPFFDTEKNLDFA